MKLNVASMPETTTEGLTASRILHHDKILFNQEFINWNLEQVFISFALLTKEAVYIWDCFKKIFKPEVCLPLPTATHTSSPESLLTYITPADFSETITEDLLKWMSKV